MSVLSFAADDLFILRIIKYLGTNPSNKWANSYEFKAKTEGDVDAFTALVTAWVAFEAAMSVGTVVFDHALVSTWEADSKPYNPATFLSVPLTETGSGVPPTDPLPLSQCLSVRRVPASGRFGHIFYRGWLKEGDVSAPAGIPVLGDATALQATMDAALDETEAGLYLLFEASVSFKLVMVPADGESSRDVSSLVVGGVSQLPLDHAWFNRTSS